MIAAHDPETLAFYDREAAAYVGRYQSVKLPRLESFLDRLVSGAHILELGCGGGRDAERMIERGFSPTLTDGSPGLAAQAEQRLGRPVRVMLFDELDAVEAYDAVWANACLLHVPEAALPAILAHIHRALKPGGLFCASYKSGDGGERDSLGRYYNFPSEETLRGAYAAAGPWAELTLETGEGGGYDGVRRTWLFVTARR
jgi:SAM-dependent methyltransferase